MISTSKTLLFFGNERLVSGLPHSEAPILQGLIERGYIVKAIISHHSESKSRTARPLEVARIAELNNIPLLLPDKPNDIYDQLRLYGADAAILVAYGRIIPQSIIDLFPLGIINVHPSLLPHYRGPTPIETPIINGDIQSGVSIMRLSAGMDDGPVFASRPFTITPSDDKFDVFKKAQILSTELFFDTLPQILDGSLTPVAQNNEQSTYSYLFTKQDAWLDSTKLTASEADRRIRAQLGFPKTKMKIMGHEIIITKAHVSNEQKTVLDVLFSDGEYLSIDELIAPSGKHINADAFLRGYS